MLSLVWGRIESNIALISRDKGSVKRSCFPHDCFHMSVENLKLLQFMFLLVYFFDS